jgi:Ser/Thr protein kinase RdoA (MazF antagonist)
MAHTETKEEIALAALNQYPVIIEEIRFLGDSGNITFYVEAPEGSFLLRIHQALLGLQDDIWLQPDIIESELVWLAALRRDTKIVVQEPIQNLEGRLVTQVLVNDTQDVFNCSLLRWIDGCVSNAERIPQQAYNLGALMAQLHCHSREWKLPQNFVRPAFDENRFGAALSAFYPAVTMGLIEPVHFQMLTNCAEKIVAMMKNLGTAPDVWGLIHADLHDGNYLFNNEEIRPIDFSRCGFGHYLYDIGESIQYLMPIVRSSFFEGYQSIWQLPESYLQVVEGFFIAATIYNYSFHLNNPKEHELISEDVQHISKTLLPKYLEGESFLLG